MFSFPEGLAISRLELNFFQCLSGGENLGEEVGPELFDGGVVEVLVGAGEVEEKEKGGGGEEECEGEEEETGEG